MLETTAWMYRIDLSVVSDLRELCFKKPDIIAFGAVVEAKVKKSSGHLCVHVYLIDGKTLKPIDKQFIRKDVDKKRTPFSLQTPIHTIGYHGDNFHPQRSIFNLAAYQCAMEIICLINRHVD